MGAFGHLEASSDKHSAKIRVLQDTVEILMTTQTTKASRIRDSRLDEQKRFAEEQKEILLEVKSILQSVGFFARTHLSAI